MKLLNFIKGLLKKREVSKLKPDENFEFKEYNYFEEDNIESNFNLIYCNNFTDTFCTSDHEKLALINSSVILPKSVKVLEEVTTFINVYHTHKAYNYFDYENLNIQMTTELVIINLRGDLNFYRLLCDNIHNNIITKYIRNNLFPNELSISTPDKFMGNMLNSIIHPNKEIDILFIEDKSDVFDSVIGLSIDRKCEVINVNDYKFKSIGTRHIVYIEINKLPKDILDYIITNVKHGNKLIDFIHTDNDDEDNINLDIDEIIDED